MDDLISREGAIRLYCREHCGWEPEECGFTLERDGTEDCYSVRFLKELPSAQQWIPCSERLPERTNPLHARDTYLVRLESGCIKTLFYEYDNSDRCRPEMSPLFSEGWEKTAVPVTHWMPLPDPPKEK